MGPNVGVVAQVHVPGGRGPGARAEDGVGGSVGLKEDLEVSRSFLRSANTECQLHARPSQQVPAHLGLR